MISKNKDSYDCPEDMKNFRELVTALNILTTNIATIKNNILRVMNMLFIDLSNVLGLNHDTVNILETYHTAKDFTNTYDSNL